MHRSQYLGASWKLFMSETTFGRQVIEKLRLLKWFAIKTHGNEFQEGLPDWLLIHPDHGVKFLELKLERGRFTRAQKRLFPLMAAAGAKIYIGKPSDVFPDLVYGEPNLHKYLKCEYQCH